MTRRQIIVKVAPDGTVHAETKGIKGPKCLDAIQLLEDILEAQAISSDFTYEYSEAEASSTAETNDVLTQR
jgi:hypothetical protein